MVLLNDEIVKKLHLLEPAKKVVKKVSTDSLTSSNIYYIISAILGIILVVCIFIKIKNYTKYDKAQD